MRRTWVALGLLAGCASPPPENVSLLPGDQARFQERLRAALEAPFVLARFRAQHESGGRVKTSCQGTTRGYRSGIVLVEEEAASGQPQRLLRVGDRAWVFRGGWKPAEEAGFSGWGTGFQNAYEVLSILEAASAEPLFYNRGGMACPGLKNVKFLGPLTDRSDVRPLEGASMEGVLSSGFREGSMITRFTVLDETKGVWTAQVDIESWGPAPPMTFDDIPSPFTPDMKAAVRKAMEGASKK